MSRRAELPGEDRVREVMAHVISAAREDGRKPAVSVLARELGMTNPTFWRHFPGIARELADLRRSTGTGTGTAAAPGQRARAEAENARLRREKAELCRDLDLAKAVIQRLALENGRRRRELEAAGKVTRIRPRNPGGGPQPGTAP